MRRVWFYRPTWWWSGPVPWYVGTDETDRVCVCVGYPFTGRVVIATNRRDGER